MARSTLRQVLDYFEVVDEPIALSDLAVQLNISPPMLSEMIQHWVRKGKLREINLNNSDCTQCGIQSSCPFVMTMPRMYELVGNETEVTPSCACGCGTGSKTCCS